MCNYPVEPAMPIHSLFEVKMPSLWPIELGDFVNILIIDGHPAPQRLTSHLLGHYAASVGAAASVQIIAVRDLTFDPNLKHGYGAEQDWEPDLQRVAAAIDSCDHLVVGFPLWWGGEPAPLKGLLDRILLPGYAFRYHRDDLFWQRLLSGRSGDVIVTMDTPPWYLLLVYGDPIARRWKHQVLGFCGFKPVRILRLGPTRRGAATRKLPQWLAQVERMARSAAALKRGVKQINPPGRAPFAQAVDERKS
jgi:NAD(P)H dehydrogenase (quinone)